MAVEWLTYSDLGERLGCSPEAARQRAIRNEWPRRTGNDGRAEVKVDPEEVLDAIPPYRREKAERPSDTPSTPEPAPVEPPADTRALEALEGHIETLKGMLTTAERQVSAERKRADDERGRADVERARADELAARIDRLRSEALKAAEENADHDAKVERDLAELRRVVEAMRKGSEPRAWWRRLAG